MFKTVYGMYAAAVWVPSKSLLNLTQLKKDLPLSLHVCIRISLGPVRVSSEQISNSKGPSRSTEKRTE
jgi:hypothetical protein